MAEGHVRARLEGMATDPSPLAAELSALLLADPREQAARLSMLVHQFVSMGKNPVDIIDALVGVDDRLFREGERTPAASRLISLTATLIRYADASLFTEQRDLAEAERAPLIFIDKKTLLCAPPRHIDEEAFLRFTDRLLGAVQRRRIKKVLLLSTARNDDNAALDPLMTALIDDLKTQRVQVEMIG